jgi:GAF domain-containing protein
MGPPERDSADPILNAALLTIREAARRGVVASRFQPEVEDRLLQSIVDATVRLFEAEAASIALFERDPDRLEFRVAAGPRGIGAVGMSVAPTQGIAGYVYSTGESLALSDVASDPRFDRAVAERTGYVPQGLMAVPILHEERALGVLQVLDRQTTFSLGEMDLLGMFANQAAIALDLLQRARTAKAVLEQADADVGAVARLAAALDALEEDRRDAGLALLRALEDLLQT